MFAQTIEQAPHAEFVRDVRAGLGRNGQKEVPSAYLYDEIGAALFETITLLPEYGLTRADARILEEHAAEVADRAPSPVQPHAPRECGRDRKSTRLNSSHLVISYAVFCLKKKKKRYKTD